MNFQNKFNAMDLKKAPYFTVDTKKWRNKTNGLEKCSLFYNECVIEFSFKLN